MRNLVFPLVFFFIIQSNVYGNRNVFTSTSCFSMGGAGSLFLSANAQIKNPAVFNQSRSVTTSIVKYPALISSQSLNLNFPLDNIVFSSSLKHISYGVFKGYNEYGEDIGSYRSYETWIEGYLSKTMNPYPIFLGSNMSLKSANFSSLNIKTLSTSIGAIGFFKNKNNAVGFSINQIGLKLLNHELSYTIPSFILGGSKKLNYLPAVVYFDFLIEKKYKTEFFMGTCFNFYKNLKILVGSSTRKFDQNTSQNLVRSILGATGFGFIYDYNQILIQYGFYYYGVGIRVDGLNIGIRF